MADAVIVGSGPNGLAAAVTLARAGLRVEVYEAADTIGGGLRSQPLFDADIAHDICSAVHPMAPVSRFFRAFDLAARGVELLTPEVSYAQPLDGGRAALAHRDLAATCAGLGPDGERWRRLMAPLLRHSEGVVDFVLSGQRALPGAGIADGERDVAPVAVHGGQHRDIGAGLPVRGDLQPPGQPPVVAGDGAVGGERGRLDDPGQPGAGGDLQRAGALVVADAVDVHAELLGRIHRDPEVDGLAGGRRGGGGEALDLPVDIVCGAGAGDPGGALRTDPPGRPVDGPGLLDMIDVPRDHPTGVVEVVLTVAQPGQRSLAERIRHRVRERS
ncbi:hypothetical protein SANTM175S_08675 [Streptomyces antimycoticus]